MTNEEMVALFEERFNRIDERFNGIDERFDKSDERFNQLEKRMDEQFATVNKKVDDTRVLIEDVDAKIGFVGEGIRTVDEKLEHFRKETGKNFTKLDGRVTALEAARRR